MARLAALATFEEEVGLMTENFMFFFQGQKPGDLTTDYVGVTNSPLPMGV